MQAPNFFRFHSDGAQWSAGLGDYAYNELGWKTAAIIGDDYSFPYTSLAGFVAEFCAVGGKVTKRIWPPLGEKDYSSFISQIPDDVDGIYYGIGGAGLVSFMKQYQEQKGKIDPKKTMGNVFFDDPLVLKEVSNAVTGAYTAGPTAADSNEPAVAEYLKDLTTRYGKEIAGLGPSVFIYNYYTAAWAPDQGSRGRSRATVSDQSKLQEALNERDAVDAPWGEIKLDENRNGVADNFVKEIVPDTNGDKVPDVKTIRARPGRRADVRRDVHGRHAAAGPHEPEVRGRQRRRRGSATPKRSTSRRSKQAWQHQRHPPTAPRRSSACGGSAGASAASTPCATWTSRSGPANAGPSSGPTAPARRRCST